MALGRHVTALVDSFQTPKRKREQPFAALKERLDGQELAPDLRALLECWVDYDGTCDIDDLTIYPDCIEEPVPDADGDDRDDLLCIGQWASGDMLAVKWPPEGKTELFWMWHDAGWDAEGVGDLEAFLENRVEKAHDKGKTTDLDGALK